MSEVENKIKSFINLNAWTEGHKLVLDVYKATRKFPDAEKFALVDQMRRCAVSITSNVAEGFSRYSKKEKIQFYHIALGSTTELQNQLIISRDLRFMSIGEFQSLMDQAIVVHKLLNGLIKSLRQIP